MTFAGNAVLVVAGVVVAAVQPKDASWSFSCPVSSGWANLLVGSR